MVVDLDDAAAVQADVEAQPGVRRVIRAAGGLQHRPVPGQIVSCREGNIMRPDRHQDTRDQKPQRIAAPLRATG